MRYAINDYLIVSWQEDDLPLFGKVEDIVVIEEKALFCVSKYQTHGFDHHFHCYVITKVEERLSCWLSDIIDYQPLKAHSRRDGSLCIVTRYFVEKV